MDLTGTETVSIELAAKVAGDAADLLARRLPAQLALERDATGAGNVSVLVLEMRGLGLGRLPGRFDYREVLYRVGVTLGANEPAWLALRCDIDKALVRQMAAAVIRYPVRRARIDLEERGDDALVLRARTDDDRLEVTLGLAAHGDMPAAIAPRRTFVVDRARLFEVPWAERAAPVRRRAEVLEADADACRAVFGVPITFEREVLVHRGRTHMCGRARAV